MLVDIITPATACTKEEIILIKNFLKNNGLNYNIFLEEKLTLGAPLNHEFPAFAAHFRFEQLKRAIENPASGIIWCARGGYGSAELLPFLYQMPKPQKSKIFIGFSDISTLNNFLIQEWGWNSITAPLLAQIALKKVNESAIKSILDLLSSKITTLKYKLKPLTTDNYQLSTPLVGGCISVLAGSFATKNQLDWQNKILFLEDEGEDGERLDRYFTQMITVMIEQKNFPAAILLGNFLEANPHGTPKAENIQIAIARLAKKIIENNLNIPLFEEISGCLGHSKNMMPLILGREAVIEDGWLVQKL